MKKTTYLVRSEDSVESIRLVCTQAHSDKIQAADQLEPTQFRQWKDRQQHHKLMESQTPALRLNRILHKTAQDRMVSKWAVSTDQLETRIATEDPDMVNHGESAAIIRGATCGIIGSSFQVGGQSKPIWNGQHPLLRA